MSDEPPKEARPAGKQVSNPFSKGGGGPRFEVQVQAAFATLMLARGFAPCLQPCWPIKSIKQQARSSVDDLVVYVSNQSGTETRRLLVQIKHGINFTKSNTSFGETIAAAWRDFNNPDVFTRGKDAIAIISGPLSATDVEDTRRILEWARDQASAQEFLQNVGRANFSSDTKREKLAAFRAHIDAAANRPVGDGEVVEFLRHLHILSYDLDVRAGMMHALLHTIVGRHCSERPDWLFDRILGHVSSTNQNAGTLTADLFPPDIREAFQPQTVETMPASLASKVAPASEIDWNASEFADALAVANLIGGWNEESHADMAIVAALTPDEPDAWLRRMREVLQRPDPPLAHTNGVWTVKDRMTMWASLAPRVFNGTLSAFQGCVLRVLRELNPAFELKSDQRFAAPLYRKVLSHSETLRSGMADTLALLGTSMLQLPNCALTAGQDIAAIVVHDLFEGADWRLWGSLDRLLPTLAEASRRAFLDAVEHALRQQPCPFDHLFAQEGVGITGGNYMTGLLWALETLAWEEIHLVRVSVILAELASRDPGGNWSNRPGNSLTTIFLPWLPQTLASVEKREVAIQAVIDEQREIGWRLLLSLLPSHHSLSWGSHKPKWRNKPAFDEVPRPTREEYRAQVNAYAQIAIEIVRSDPDKLEGFIDSLDILPERALYQALEFAKTDVVKTLPDERRLPIWSKLCSFVRRHRQFSEAEWALPTVIVDEIDQLAESLAPQDPSVAHRILFSKDTWELHDDRNDWKASETRLAQRQLEAVQEIFDHGGVAAVVSFAETVENPLLAGMMLGKLNSNQPDSELLPRMILSPEPKQRELVHGYVCAKFQRLQWNWFDAIDSTDWSNDELAQSLTYLPFDMETWRRAKDQLPDDGKEYWTRVPVHPFMQVDDDYVAVDALLSHGRPRAAVARLAARVHGELAIDPERAIKALLAAIQSSEPSSSIDLYGTAILIKALQDDDQADMQNLVEVEWAYLQLLEHSHVTEAKTLGVVLASNPDEFCGVIRMIFRSEKEEESSQSPESTEERSAIAQNTYRLLRNWSVVPGTDTSGNISGRQLVNWIDAVKASLENSGHLTVGLHMAGKVFIHAPADPSGTYMHHTVASVLNREDMVELRRGYELGVYNSRGMQFVDPTGEPERALARDYNERADAMENAGFHRLAGTLRLISERYRREEREVIARHGTEDESE